MSLVHPILSRQIRSRSRTAEPRRTTKTSTRVPSNLTKPVTMLNLSRSPAATKTRGMLHWRRRRLVRSYRRRTSKKGVRVPSTLRRKTLATSPCRPTTTTITTRIMLYRTRPSTIWSPQRLTGYLWRPTTSKATKGNGRTNGRRRSDWQRQKDWQRQRDQPRRRDWRLGSSRIGI